MQEVKIKTDYNNLIIRKAIRSDVPKIVRLLANDFLGAQRESYIDPLPEAYYKAFNEINADKNNLLIVAESNNKIIGTLQLTIIPGLTYQGGKRGLIEAVHVDETERRKGIGKLLIDSAIAEARQRGCCLVQLTSNKKRNDAHRFYEKLGFSASHEGFKLNLTKN